MDRDGCLTVDGWTSGKGRYTTNRALPPFVHRFERKDYRDTGRPHRGTPERAAYEFFRKPGNEKRKFVLVLDIHSLYGFMFENSLGKEYDLATCR